MIKRKKRKLFEAFLAAAVVMLAVQIVLSFPFETLAKQTTTDSSESIYLLDGKADSSLTEKGIEGKKKQIELQREQSKSSEKDETTGNSETKENKTKESVKEGNKEKSSKNDISLFAVDVATEVNIGNLKYRVWPDGNAGVIGFYGSPTVTVTIPPTVNYGGTTYKVVDIYENAFTGKYQIENIIFQPNNNIRSIDIHAFSNLTRLKSIDLSNCKNLTIVNEEAFSGCRQVSSLKFPSESKLRTIGKNAFRNLDGIAGSVLRIPDSVVSIGPVAFQIDRNYFDEVHHKKVASVKGTLPSLEVAPVALPEEAKNYDSRVNSSKDKTLLHKAAKWTNEERTTAEIRLDYGNDFDRLANLDVVFVMDYSGSMNLPATTKNDQGVVHNFPRGFLTNDIVYDASKMLVDETNRPAGYDNQVAMVAFEGADTPLYKSNGFTNNSEDVKQFLIKNPNYNSGKTNYNAGLQGAIDLIEQRANKDRIPVVIFLSDGLPEPIDKNGVTQANILRARGVNVYPIAIYTGSTISQNLKNISYDRNTVYIADDTEAFETIMKKVLNDVINHAEPLEVQIEDILSEEFQLLTGGQADFEISPDGGQVRIDGQKLTWDLRGCAQGVAHTLKIKVKVKEGTESTATGILDTNDSMGATDDSIKSNEQPKLERYLAHYHFENADDPAVSLPKEVMDLLPKTSGGYGNNHNVQVDDITPKEVKTADGRTWEFLGWDYENQTISNQDVTFLGKWKFKGYDFSFIKFNDSKQGLEGAEFSLYAWKRTTDPTNSDLVNDASIAEGKWTLIDTQTSQANGRVDFYVPAEEGKYFQLVETKAPERYDKPQGQWRFTFDQNGYITNNTLNGIGGQNNTLPPSFEQIKEGEFAGLLGVINKASAGYLPETGGLGQHMTFTLKAIGIWLLGMVLVGLYFYINRRKEHSSSKK